MFTDTLDRRYHLGCLIYQHFDILRGMSGLTGKKFPAGLDTPLHYMRIVGYSLASRKEASKLDEYIT